MIAIIGLGYVGLPLARLFATKYKVVGYDIDAKRIEELNQGIDRTDEVAADLLKNVLREEKNTSYGLYCTNQIDAIKDCSIYIVTVPTPVDKYNHPDLTPLKEASRTVAAVLSKGDLVVYESTVYPGVTEEECIPVLEEVSNLKFNQDFFVGYSPERINPGDKNHTVEKIKKVTSGSTPEIATKVDDLYNSVLTNGTHKAPSIRVAEASKIIENAQRDVNIAFVNELSRIFNLMDIDTYDVLEAASTKWNFIKMTPGLVGGHCIGIDPYYLIQKSQVYGYLPRIMSDARRLNDSMGNYVGKQVIRLMNKKGVLVKDAHVLILGITFKENCPDIRNTKIIDIYDELKEYTQNIQIYDPCADSSEVKMQFGIDLITKASDIPNTFDAIILAVAHDQLKDLDIPSFLSSNGIIYDVKGVLPKEIIDGRL